MFEVLESYRITKDEHYSFLIPYIVDQWTNIIPVGLKIRDKYEDIRFKSNIPNENGIRKCSAMIWNSGDEIGVIELDVENKWQVSDIIKMSISYYRPAKGGGEVKVMIYHKNPNCSVNIFIAHTGSIEETEDSVSRLIKLFEGNLVVEADDQGYNC
jgi:hypothetical protein